MSVIFKKNNKIIKIAELEGIFEDKDFLSPSYINVTNPKYIEIDNVFYSGLIVVNYSREYSSILLKQLIDNNMNINISCFYEKQDNYKVIRDLTYHIGDVASDLKDIKQNSSDIEIASFTYNDAKYIRKEIQVNNEDIYFLYIYLELFSENIKELENTLNKVEGICQANGMNTRRANFRQEQVFKSCLPIHQNCQEIKNAAKRNVLSSGIICTYPFISSSIFDDEGILYGTNIYNNSLIFIDRFYSDKYKNANMCVFGTSGAGKSFFIKLLILRYSYFNTEQFIIDPEREYTKICEKLNGTLIKIGPSSNTYINILEIREETSEDGKGFLATKISKLIGFFKLIFGELDEQEKAILEEKLIETYALKNITFDDKSLYKKETKEQITIKPVFKESNQMPILEDLYYVLGKEEKTKYMQIKLIPFVKGSLKFFNQCTNV